MEIGEVTECVKRRASSRNSQDAGWRDEVEERKGQTRDLWITEISGRLGDGLDGHFGSFAENRLDKSNFNGHVKRQLAGQRGAEQPSEGGLESPWERSCSQERSP